MSRNTRCPAGSALLDRWPKVLGPGLLLALLPLLPQPVLAAPKTTANNLETDPPGAEVTLLEPAPEKLLGVTPLAKVKIPQGPVKLRFRLAGYEDKLELLTIGKAAATYKYQLVRKIVPATLELAAGDDASRGAEVAVDGEVRGTLPVKTQVTPGRHQIVVRKDGFVTWEKWTEFTENQLVSLEVNLKAQDKPKGALFVSSSPVGAEIKLNGAPRGRAPQALENLEPGAYTVEFTLEGHKSATQQVTVREGGRETVSATLESTAPVGGELKVLCDAPAALILVDGEERGGPPVTITDIKPGEHVVECRAPNYPAVTQTVQTVVGQVKTVVLGPRKQVTASRGSLSVVANVPGAIAQLNDGDWKKTPAQFDEVNPGKYQVTVKAEGHAPWSETVSVEIQKTTEVSATLKATGKVEVTLPPGKQANVYVDGAISGPAPTTVELPVGPHKIRLQAEGLPPEEYEVAVQTGQTVRVVGKLLPPPEPPVVRQSNPTSAHTQEPGKGSAQFGVGFPAIFEATVSAGVIPNLELGVQLRNTLHILTEFEIQAQYKFIGTKAFAVGLEAGIGGGLGGDDRNGFTFQVKPIGSLLLGDSSAFSLYTQFRFFSDTLSEEFADDFPDRVDLKTGDVDTGSTGFLWPIGLIGEFKLAQAMNLWIRAEMNLVASDDGRLIYEELAEFLNGRYHVALGLTWVFN